MAVVDPLKVVITNFQSRDQTEWLDASYWADIPKGTRKIPFTRELYIERSDFSIDPPKGFYRLKPGGEVRLRYSYFIRCDEIIGSVEEVTILNSDVLRS